MKQWLVKWEQLYAEVILIGHTNILNRVILKYFVDAIGKTDPSWAQTANYDLGLKHLQREPIATFMEILNLYRQVVANQPSSTNAAYPTSLNSQEQPKASNKGQPKASNPTKPNALPRKYICGSKHWYSECSYLIEAKHTSGWKPDPKITKKVEEAIKDPKVKANIKKSKKRNAFRSPNPATTAELPTESQSLNKNFTIIWYHNKTPTPSQETPALPASASSYPVLKTNDYNIINY